MPNWPRSHEKMTLLMTEQFLIAFSQFAHGFDNPISPVEVTARTTNSV
jgi:hypothetical protein